MCGEHPETWPASASGVWLASVAWLASASGPPGWNTVRSDMLRLSRGGGQWCAMPSPMGRWPARVHGTDCAATRRPRGGNFAWDSPGARHPSWLSTLLAGHRGRVVAGAAADLGAEPDQRVVLAADHAFLHRDYRVVGDLDVFRAGLGAALGDGAVAQAEVVLGDLPAVGGVGRVHLQFRDPHQEPGAGEGALVLRVVADHVAHVLAQEALDALAELLRALHVDLLHPELARADRGIRGERGDLPRLGEVERHVGDEVPDHREGAQRGDRDGLT